MSIICATDFSEEAIAAATAAGALARRLNQQLWLVHVLPTSAARAFGDPLFKLAEATLDGERQRLEATGAKVGTALLSGKIEQAIVQFATGKDAKLILVGNARDSRSSWTGGHAVERLSLSSPIPLLALHSAEALEGWANGRRPLKVMLGIDRTESSQVSRDWLYRLAETGPLEVEAVHVFWPPAEYDRLGLPQPTTFDEVQPELQRILHREMTAVVGQPPPGVTLKVRVEVGFGRVADHLVDFATRDQVDVLVLGTHHRRAVGKLWSVSHHALRLAPMGVACVPSSTRVTDEVAVPELRTVLATTDFSDPGNRAIAYAFATVEGGGTVHLAHVTSSTLNEATKAQLERQLLGLVPTRARTRGIDVKIHVVHAGDVAKALVQLAERVHSDLMCLGSTGAGFVAKNLLGSVSEAVMRQSRRAVLLVRPLER